MTETELPTAQHSRAHITDSVRLSVGLVVAQLATIGSLSLIARNLGTGSFGILTAIAGAASILVDLLDFGSSSRIASSHSNGHKHSINEVMGTKAKIASAGLVLAACSVPLIAVSSWIGVAAMSVAFATVTSLNQAHYMYLRGLPRSTTAALVTAAERVAALGVTALLLATGAGVLAYPSGLLVGALMVSGYMPIVWKGVAHTWRQPFSRRAWTGTRSFGISGLMTDISLLDTPLVALASGQTTAGIFAAAARLTGPLGVPASAMTSLLFPRLRQRSDRQAWKAAVDAISLLGLVSAVLLAVVAWTAPTLVHVALGSGFDETVPVLRIYCIGMVAASLNQPMSVTLQATGRQSAIARLVAVGVVSALIATPLAAMTWGATGAAWCFTVMQFAILTVLLRWVRRARATASQ